MKKKLSLLLVAVMLIACLSTSVFAVAAGETATVNFSINSNPGYASYRAVLNYNHDVLELVDIAQGPASVGMGDKNLAAGSFAVTNLSQNTGTGVLFTATFKVKAGAPAGTYPVSASVVEAYDADFNEISFGISGGSVTVDAPPHVCAPAAVPAKAATCEVDGYEAHFKCECGKLYADAAGTTPISAATPIPAKGHTWDAGKVTTEPTCEAEGVKTFTCQNDASHTKTEAVAALGHAWDAGKVTTPATCTEDGVMTYTCQNDASHTKTEPIKAGHKLSGWKTDANNHWKVCEVEGCGAIVEKGAHNMKTVDGSKDKQCTVCGYRVEAPSGGDSTLDDQPKTGDIYAEMAMFAGVAALAVAAVVIGKRKARD